MKLIDKNKLLKEVEELKQNLSASPIVVIKDVESLVESLEVKEVEVPVSKDLEEAADKHLVEKGYLLTTNNGEHLAEVEAKGLFKAGAQWQKQQLVDKACEWLKAYRQDSPDGTGYIPGIVNDKTIEDFKQAIKE